MEIKGLGGVYSAYKTTKVNAPKKNGAAASAKNIANTDKVEFGFAAAISAAKAEIASEVKSDADVRDLVDAAKSAGTVSQEELAALILNF